MLVAARWRQFLVLVLVLASVQTGVAQAPKDPDLTCALPTDCPPSGTTVDPCSFTGGDALLEPAYGEGLPACNVVRSFWGMPARTLENFQEIAEAGFNVIISGDGQTALDLAQETGLRVILSDDSMPRPVDLPKRLYDVQDPPYDDTVAKADAAPGRLAAATPEHVSELMPTKVRAELQEHPNREAAVDEALASGDPLLALGDETFAMLPDPLSSALPVDVWALTPSLDATITDLDDVPRFRAAEDVTQSGYRSTKDGVFADKAGPAFGTLTQDQRNAVRDIVDKYGDHPALAGYFVVDEPQPHELDFYSNVVNLLRHHDPDHLAFVNFSPAEFPGAALGPAMGGFADATLSPTICYDYYPFMESGFRSGFTDFLHQAGNESRARQGTAAPLDFWDYVQLAEHTTSTIDYRRIGEDELRYQSMQSLAHGSRGVLYFTYQSSNTSGFEDDGIILRDGSRSDHYGEVQRVHADVSRIGRYLSLADSQAVTTDASVPLAFSGTSIEVANDAFVTVGGFEMPAGLGTSARRHYALLANAAYDTPATVEFAVGSGTAEWLELTPTSQAWQTSLPPGGIPLAAGGAVLVRW